MNAVATLQAVAIIVGSTPDDIVDTKNRETKAQRGRTVLFGYLWHHTNYSYPEMARMFLGRDTHSTAMACTRRFEALPVLTRLAYLEAMILAKKEYLS